MKLIWFALNSHCCSTAQITLSHISFGRRFWPNYFRCRKYFPKFILYVVHIAHAFSLCVTNISDALVKFSLHVVRANVMFVKFSLYVLHVTILFVKLSLYFAQITGIFVSAVCMLPISDIGSSCLYSGQSKFGVELKQT